MEEKFLKLTSAVYGILAFFPESDPLKNKAKEKVLSIMENLTLFSSRQISIDLLKYFPQDKSSIQSKILEDIAILLNYFKIGKSQGWISDVNYLIVLNEYEKIEKEIKSTALDKKNPKAFQIFQGRAQTSKEPVLNIESKEHLQSSPLAKTSSDFVSDQPKFSDRQSRIIKFLEDYGRAQVMDLQKVLPNITKRTIRRDIDELINMGRIARMGEFNQIFYKIK